MLNNGDSHASIFLFTVMFVIVNSKNNLNNIITTKKGGDMKLWRMKKRIISETSPNDPFGAKWLGSVVKGYPAQDISRHNALKIILANSYSSNYTQFY